jgi:hypothetical protein
MSRTADAVVRRLAAVAMLALAGCARGDFGRSYVGPLEASQAPLLASGIVDYVARKVPGTRRPIQVMAEDKALTPFVVQGLTDRGYRVIDRRTPDVPAAGAHTLAYAVSPEGREVYVRVFLDRTDAARLYAVNATGKVEAAGPYTERELAE